MNRSKILRQAAFTLIELMVVLVIIGILAGVVVVNYAGRAEKAQETVVKHDMSQISNAIEFFKLDTGNYPESLEELYSSTGSDENWRGPYLKTLPRDPWGREYIYERNEGQTPPFTLKSYGRDGMEGGEGEDKDYSNIDDLQEGAGR